MANPALEDMLGTTGIRYAALVSGSGELLDSAGQGADVTLVKAARAIVGSLQQTVQAGDLTDMLIELNGGPVLFTPQGENTLVAGFDEVGNLGRVRFAVKRALGRLK